MHIQASHASALQSIEYRLAFEDPSAEAMSPIADHLCDMVAICRQSGVTRSAVKPLLKRLDDLHQQDEQRRTAPPCVKKPRLRQRQCATCHASDALIDEELYRVCAFCGVIAETHRIQDDVWLQPSSNRHGAVAKAPRELSPDALLAAVRRVSAAHRLAPVHTDRAMYLATLYVLERPASPASAQLIATSCVVYSLLETWARLLVPAKVFRNQQWTTWWVLPTRSLKQRNNFP